MNVVRKLEFLYSDPKSPVAFGGVNSLYKEAKRQKLPVTLDGVKKFLRSKKTYTLHVLKPGRFLRPQMIAYGFRYMFQMDIFYSLYPNSNRKQRFILLVVE